ncbi:HlyD family efflux transporter periplasmic adaptor subunit [Labilibaculum sp. A4]|uniref:efflux RND transporter periplasmic adaptor subunit n=1 Tax=Labilibaculum euxinus TaxID=2686357 RepID=UPI00136637BD|nr:HlyD family efflux transporter periplasmic adaptor subunit [Labilibaculum euxinus]MDQ1769325.1 HlyD family efflux transporter periplasmic adaptor subunit [Labilibaculum euxinus]MWN74850.1 HlyD family efflux transporter periplasmic adaptor subunit [Labilibaculum euxinus]
MRKLILISLLIFSNIILFSCRQKSSNSKTRNPIISVKTTSISQGDIEKYVDLNGKVVYLKKNKITAPFSGYITRVATEYGDIVKKNNLLFEMQTKESKALNNTLGKVEILAPSDGVISELNTNETGTFVTEGDLLSTIVENSKILIQLNVPYQYNGFLKTVTSFKVMTSDDNWFYARLFKIIPSVNEINQTQIVLLQPIEKSQLPENLNVTVKFIIEKKTNSLLVSKKAILTNQKQSNYWVMKITKDSLAVKIPIAKGIENDSVVEILSKNINLDDVIICEGAYGLSDSSIVRISK